MRKILPYLKSKLGNGNAFVTLLFGLLCTLIGFFINFSIEFVQIKQAVNASNVEGFQPIKSQDLQNQISSLGSEISEVQDLQRINEMAWKDIRSDINSMKNDINFIVNWIKPDVKKRSSK